MTFQEPTGAYFADFQHIAVHLESGQEIQGYLDLDSVDVQGTDLSPTISVEQQPYFECTVVRWNEVGARARDRLRIGDRDWIIEERPRDDGIMARVKLRRVYADDAG